MDDKRKYVETIRSLEADNQKISADSASAIRIRADLESLKSQFDNCQITNQGLDRDIKNIAANERRTQENLRKCQASLAGSVDQRSAALADQVRQLADSLDRCTAGKGGLNTSISNLNIPATASNFASQVPAQNLNGQAVFGNQGANIPSYNANVSGAPQGAFNANVPGATQGAFNANVPGAPQGAFNANVPGASQMPGQVVMDNQGAQFGLPNVAGNNQ